MIPREFSIFIEGSIKALEEEEERHQWRNALLASVIVNSSQRKKGSRIAKQKDFMPKKKQTDDEMYNEIVRLNKLFGGKDFRKG